MLATYTLFPPFPKFESDNGVSKLRISFINTPLLSWMFKISGTIEIQVAVVVIFGAKNTFFSR